MNKYRLLIAFCVSMSWGWYSCSLQNDSLSSGVDSSQANWNIPVNEIISGGVPKDGIPSLFDPEKISQSQATYLQDSELVVGVVVDGQAYAYPHAILDWHEIVNEEYPAGKKKTVSFCPLTGSAIVFDGENANQKLTFGVSGLLYNNNLIMFDRQTNSHWPQMRLQCDNGSLRNVKQKIYPSFETNWGTWKKLCPNTLVLSTNTSYDRPYSQSGSAYPGYRSLNSPPLFRSAVSFLDDRLPPKQRVLGVISNPESDTYITRAYVINPSMGIELVNDQIDDKTVLVINDGVNNFTAAYSRSVNGQLLSFTLDANVVEFPYTFKDEQTQSTWNVLGEATAGPLAGEKLEHMVSYVAYWFAWGVFHQGAEIHGR
ncbi:MAG: DUF3179 domain-containing protein [bacterium]